MKLPNGFGTVYKLQGKRRRPFVVKKTVNGKQKALGYFAEFDEAMTFLINYNHNPTLFSSKTTFKEIYERWKTQKFDKISASSISGYEISYKHCKQLHKMAFRDIRYGHLEQVINNVRQAGAGYATQKKVRVLLEQLYAYASKYDLVERDYARFLEIDKHVAVYKKKPFSVRERNRLWKNRDVECVDDILILIYSGLRLGEYLSLTSQDINKRGRYLNVKKSKTPSGIRIVPINKKIWPIVEKRLSNYHICPYRSYDKFRKHFDKACTLLHMHHTPHECRHTCASMLDSSGANDTAVKMILGHARKGVTKAVYTHKTFHDLRKAIDSI